MAVMSVEELYQKYVRLLPVKERLRLVSITTDGLTREKDEKTSRKRSLLEFEGLGKHNPTGMDAQEYVNEMRSEWDRRQ